MVRVASILGDQRPGGLRTKRASLVLRTYIVGRMRVKKLHIDRWAKVVLVLVGRRDHPNLGMCWGSVSPSLSCSRLHQLIKVGAVTQSYLWALSVSIRDSLVKQIVTRGRQLTKVVLWAASLSTVDPVSPLKPWDESTVSKPFFPR